VKSWFFSSAAVAATAVSLTMVSIAAPQDGAAPAGRGRGRGAPRRGPAGPVPLLSDGKPDLSGVWNGQQIVAQTGDCRGNWAGIRRASAADAPLGSQGPGGPRRDSFRGRLRGPLSAWGAAKNSALSYFAFFHA